jgi:hypothetical protein
MVAGLVVVSLTDDDIHTCRTAIVRIARLTDVQEQRREVRQYPEPLKGVIGRGVRQILEWRKGKAARKF